MDLVDPKYIRAAGERSECHVDALEYMTSGGGRFVGAYNFKAVRNFLGGNDNYSNIPVGSYSFSSLMQEIGSDPSQKSIIPHIQCYSDQYSWLLVNGVI
jgi:hypothetical protein